MSRARASVCQAIRHELPAQGAQLGDAAGIGLGQRAADRGHVGQAGEPEGALEQGVVAVVAGIAQFAVAQEQMDDQEQGDEMVAEDGGHPGLGEAGAQALLELEAGEQGLDEDQPREGRQRLVLEAEGGELVEFAMGRGSAMFHVAVTSRGFGVDEVWQSHRSQLRGHCPRNSAPFPVRGGWTSPPVRSSERSLTTFPLAFYAASLTSPRDSCATWGWYRLS